MHLVSVNHTKKNQKLIILNKHGLKEKNTAQAYFFEQIYLKKKCENFQNNNFFGATQGAPNANIPGLGVLDEVICTAVAHISIQRS